MLSALRLAAVLVLPLAHGSGCAATRSGPTKAQTEYLRIHPLSPDEARRLSAREARRDDTLERVRVTFDGCDFERRQVDGDLKVFSVRVPIDARAIRITTDKLEDVQPGASVLVTFDHDRLKSAIVLE